MDVVGTVITAMVVEVFSSSDPVPMQADPIAGECGNATPDQIADIFVGCIKQTDDSEYPLFSFHRCLQVVDAELCTSEGAKL